MDNAAERTPAKPTAGEVIQEELKRRGWTQEHLADILGKHRPEVSNLVSGKTGVSPEMAVLLSAALGNPPEFWLALENSRQLSLIPQTAEDVKKRLRILQVAPVKEMQKRGWIRSGLSDEVLETELCRFFGVTSLDEEPSVLVAARKSDRLSKLNPIQRAWCCRARQLAGAVQSKQFSPPKLDAAEKRLRQIAAYPKEARHLPEVMREYGIRFVVVEALTGGKIDGAAFWLDKETPVIAVSIRHDRIDSFWFTVMHEFAHIRAGDAISVDDDLAGEDFKPSHEKDEMERRADERAAASLIPPAEIDSFVRRVGPLYSKERIIQFAHRIKMHPGVIVGQLQHRKEIGWSANREMLAKVRDVVTDTALTDGFGRSIAPGLI